MATKGPVPGETIHTEIEPGVREYLRSVVGYTADGYAIHYIRDDVEAQYTEEEVQTAIEELRLETLEQEHVNRVFETVHGKQQCRVTFFRSAIEMNFIVGEGTGVEVAFDREWGSKQLNVIDQIQTILSQ